MDDLERLGTGTGWGRNGDGDGTVTGTERLRDGHGHGHGTKTLTALYTLSRFQKSVTNLGSETYGVFRVPCFFGKNSFKDNSVMEKTTVTWTVKVILGIRQYATRNNQAS